MLTKQEIDSLAVECNQVKDLNDKQHQELDRIIQTLQESPNVSREQLVPFLSTLYSINNEITGTGKISPDPLVKLISLLNRETIPTKSEKTMEDPDPDPDPEQIEKSLSNTLNYFVNLDPNTQSIDKDFTIKFILSGISNKANNVFTILNTLEEVFQKIINYFDATNTKKYSRKFSVFQESHNVGYSDLQLKNISQLKAIFLETVKNAPIIDDAFENKLKTKTSKPPSGQLQLIDFNITRYKSFIAKTTTSRESLDDILELRKAQLQAKGPGLVNRIRRLFL